ncbi:hypothetical protein BH11MYX1_BH11MYX1_34170 [soil metagenome]
MNKGVDTTVPRPGRAASPARAGLAINLVLSLGMLALCVWLVWPDHQTRTQLAVAFKALDASTLAP